MSCESCGNNKCETVSGGGRMYPDSYFCCRCVKAAHPPFPFDMCDGCSPEGVTA